MSARKKYPGDLEIKLEPIYGAYLAELGGNQKPHYSAEDLKKRKEEIDSRMKSLMAHYGVSGQNGWEDLAHALAREHVRGLQVRDPDALSVGAKEKWTVARIAVLIFQMEKKMGEKAAGRGRTSEVHASKILAKNEPWKDLLDGNNPAESLRKKYQENKTNNDVRHFVRLFASHHFREATLVKFSNNGFPRGSWM